MSDRPMRLKYLKTKMKIILCIFLLCITAVSVFGQSQELNGIVGKSIEFPTKVETSGNLIYGSKAIGRVSSGALNPLTEYKGRVHWDSSTGLFSLSELRLNDSGVYNVQNDGKKSKVFFNLTVWKDNIPVSKPNVSITHNEHCTIIECTAERGTGVTLSWYREGEEKPYVSSRVESAPHLHLPVPVESGTYTCEAKNSVSNEKASIALGAHCTVGSSAGTVVPVSFLFVALIVVLIYFRCYPSARSSTWKIVLASVLDVVLIGFLIYLLYCPPAGSSTWTVVLASFLMVALIVVLIDLLYHRKDQQASVQAAIKLINSVVQPVYDGKDQQASVQAGEPMSALSPDDAAGILIQVKQLLINVVPNTDELRGPAKGDEKPEPNKGKCAIS